MRHQHLRLWRHSGGWRRRRVSGDVGREIGGVILEMIVLGWLVLALALRMRASGSGRGVFGRRRCRGLSGGAARESCRGGGRIRGGVSAC